MKKLVKKLLMFLTVLAMLIPVLSPGAVAVRAAEDTRITSPHDGDVVEVDESGYIRIKVSYIGAPNELKWAMLNVTTGKKFINNKVTKANYSLKVRITDYASPGDIIKACYAAVYNDHEEWCTPIYFKYCMEDSGSGNLMPAIICDAEIDPCTELKIKVKVAGGVPEDTYFSLKDLTTNELIFYRYQLGSTTECKLKIRTDFIAGHSYRAAYASVDECGNENWCEKVFYVRSSNAKNSSVELGVKLLSQADPQWGYERMGSSRYTYKSVGCLVTSYAMCESYRTGRDITPVNLIEDGRVTVNSSGGANGGTVQTTYKSNESDFSYQKLYDCLMSGRPAVIRLTGSSSEHFVVAYGLSYVPLDSNGRVIEYQCCPEYIMIKDPGWGYETVQELFDNKSSFYNISTLRYHE